MATGTSAGFWDEEKSPALLKHEILAGYVPQFVAKLGRRWGHVVLVDGYAGAGRYTSGAPGSALQMVQIASALVIKLEILADVFLIEREPETMKVLRQEVASYAKNPRLNIHIIEGDIDEKFDSIIESAIRAPLFIFLDPCGLVLPFERLSKVIEKRRPVDGPFWAPTEVLLNFSADAVRRIGGRVSNSTTPDLSTVTTLNRMDATVGGDWWQDFYRGSYDKETAETEVVNGYTNRLGKATKMFMQAVPVKRDIGHRPVYYLVFGTRHRQGIWHFSDIAAKSYMKWQDAVQERKFNGQLEFEGLGLTSGEQSVILEDDAVRAIGENLMRILHAKGNFMVGDYTVEVFGEYLGLVREHNVRAAIKNLYKSGQIGSNGIGSPIYELRVTRLV